jgi:uncharacterized protein (DUF1800 family)
LIDQWAIEGLRQAARSSWNLDRLKVCWLNRIIHGPEPLREKLMLFWHGRFATSDKKVEPLAAEVKRRHFAIGPIVEFMLRPRRFDCGFAYRERIKSPVEFSAGLVRMLELPRPASNPLALSATRDSQGQELTAPPNVEGWAGGQVWINSATLLERTNWAADVVRGRAENGLASFAPLDWAARYNVSAKKAGAVFLDLLLQNDIAMRRGSCRSMPLATAAPWHFAKQFNVWPTARSFNWRRGGPGDDVGFLLPRKSFRGAKGDTEGGTEAREHARQFSRRS